MTLSSIDSQQPSFYLLPMAKRPTPKKRLSSDRSGNRYAAYLRRQWKRLRGQMNSPYAVLATRKEREGKALEKITKIKA